MNALAPYVASRRYPKDVVVDIDPSACELVSQRSWEDVMTVYLCSGSPGPGCSPSDRQRSNRLADTWNRTGEIEAGADEVAT